MEYNPLSINIINLSSIRHKLIELKHILPVFAGNSHFADVTMDKIVFDYYLNSNFQTVIDENNDTWYV